MAAPDRCAYATNASGVWQVVSWDRAHDRHTVLTDKPTGVTRGRPLPDGSGVVWFDDHAGDEVGRYVVTPFDGGPVRPLAPAVAPGWSGGLSLREGRLAVGAAGRDGFTIHAGDQEGTRRIYHHRQQAAVGGLSRDGALLAISHSEHGDARHPDLRIVDPLGGAAVADLADG
ncbi:MAG: S9 family peptidase, partial [Actinomycetota bacterium]|nr:S9 family peptidase [Actinomycetota bacterium]